MDYVPNKTAAAVFARGGSNQESPRTADTEMGLALLGGYSSAEDDDPAAGADLSDSGGSSAEEAGSDVYEASAPPKPAAKPSRRVNPSPGDGDSSLPSALDVFAEISGPPDFLNRRVAEPEEVREALGVLDRRSKQGRKPPPPGETSELCASSTAGSHILIII
jgi:hypothetical protein